MIPAGHPLIKPNPEEEAKELTRPCTRHNKCDGVMNGQRFSYVVSGRQRHTYTIWTCGKCGKVEI